VLYSVVCWGPFHETLLPLDSFGKCAFALIAGLPLDMQSIVDDSGLLICVALFTSHASPFFHKIPACYLSKSLYINYWLEAVRAVRIQLFVIAELCLRKADTFLVSSDVQKVFCHFPFYALYGNMFWLYFCLRYSVPSPFCWGGGLFTCISRGGR
jgi:hypothetical protein